MARDRRSSGRRARVIGDAGDEPADPNPVNQLDDWRIRRTVDAEQTRSFDHGDTVEFPALAERGKIVDGEDEEAPQPRSARGRHARPGTGVLIGGGLLVAALALSGLAAAGIGPVRDLLGSDHGSTSGRESTHTGSSTRGSSTRGSSAATNGRTGSSSRAGNARGGSGSPGTSTPSAPGAAGGPPAPAAGQGTKGPAVGGATNGPAGGDARGPRAGGHVNGPGAGGANGPPAPPG